MTRVSLKEAYDNKDVVAQIYAIRDIAEGAEDTANNAVSTANTASEHVDALVPQVEGAVQNANNASASAQQSAQIVAGYDTRLTAAETKNTQQDTDITALQTADAQNVKLSGAQDITGRKTIVETYPRLDFKSTSATDMGSGLRLLDTADGSQKHYLYMYPNRIDIPTPSADAPSSAIVNKAYVESTDGVTNNILHRGTTEVITNQKLGMVNGSSRGINLSNRTLAIGEIQGSVIAEENIQIGYVYTDRNGMVIGYYEGTPSSVVKNQMQVLSPLISHQKIGIIKQDGKYLLCVALSRQYSVFPTVNVMYCGSSYNPLEVVMYKTPTILNVTYENFTGGAEIS